MTTITARLPRQATPVERMLLHAASGLDHAIRERIAHRHADRAALAAQRRAGDRRATAQALGAAGMIPR